jgi:superfamily I DNA and RNA helicase
MRLQNWFIRKLDDIQREVIIESIDKNIIVQGAAGSGKTNLAIHRALQAKGKGSYAIVIMTVALRRMIAYGMKELGLDNERIAYDWAWQHRGFDLIGDVYCVKQDIGFEGIVRVLPSPIYLVNGNIVRKFEKVNRETGSFGLDFADWVDARYYNTWGRRSSWFKEIAMDNQFSVTNSKYCLVPSGTLYKPCEAIIDYLIVDEAQDFNVTDYRTRFIPKVGKSISLLGDSNQKMISTGSSINELRLNFPNFKPFDLKYNYRLPKAIAKVAQKIAQPETDLLTNNMKNGGDSDFPTYPKPIVKKCPTRADEIKWIANRIQNETLDDVAILVQNDSDVQEVVKLLAENGINEVQTHYRTGKEVPFHTINTLDFSNNDLPCILDYYAAKGSEFDHVFVPFANEGHVGRQHDFFVACTRASNSLYITYSGVRTSYLENVNNQDIVEFK